MQLLRRELKLKEIPQKMANITCAISGLTFQITGFTGRDKHSYSYLSIPHTTGYYHPIFTASYGELYKLYSAHCKGKLQPMDSYLLFLAFLHSSDQIIWEHPVTLDPASSSTKQLVENNFSQLVAILEKTNLITYSSFEQPSFRVTFDNNKLEQITNWIRAWQDNLKDFTLNRADLRTKESLHKLEKELGYRILSGEPPESFSGIIAEWANKAACFPAGKSELYKKTITSCFHIDKMFKTPLPLLKEIKDYCECNIEAGSIHFHTLLLVLKEGISRHIDYLGGSTLALGYTLLPKETAKEIGYLETDTKLLEIAAGVELSAAAPVREDYDSPLELLKAKLAYRVAVGLEQQEKKAAQVKNNLGDL